MLDRVKSPVLALGLLSVLPVSSVRSTMLDRVENPVLVLELSRRYKSKAYVVSERIVYVFFFLYLFGSVLGFFLGGRVGELDANAAGYDLLVWMLYSPVGLVFFVVPALAVTSVLGERRRGTLTLVQLSLLRPFDIVWGKVVTSVAPVLLPVGLYAFALALYSLKLSKELLGYITGNVTMVTISEAARVLSFGFLGGLAVLSAVFVVSAVSVLISTFAKSGVAADAAATIVAYGCSVAFLIYYMYLAMERTAWTVELVNSWGPSTFYGMPSFMPSLIYHMIGRANHPPIGPFAFYVVLGCVAGLSVWWSCRRLRLPARKWQLRKSGSRVWFWFRHRRWFIS